MLPDHYDDEIVLNKKYTTLYSSKFEKKEIVRENAIDYEKEDVIDYEKSERTMVKNVLTTEDFFNRLDNQVFHKQILPKNCRFMDVKSNLTTLVIEEPPCLRSVSINTDFYPLLKKLEAAGKLEKYGMLNFLHSGPYRLTLSFPYIVYIFYVRPYNGRLNFNIKIFYRLSPLTSLSDYLLRVNLLNVNNDNTLCLNINSFEATNYSEIVSKCMELFWSRTFNKEYVDNFNFYADYLEIGDPFSWAYYSKIDPTFIFSVKWQTVGLLKQTINRYHSQQNDYNIRLLDINNIFTQIYTGEKKFEKEYTEKCKSVVLYNGDILSIGDEIKYEGIEYYIYSFISYEGDNPHKITLENKETSDIISMTFNNSEFTEKMEFVKDNELEVVQTKNMELHIGDIVKLKNSIYNNYKEVKKIVISRDGDYEVKLNNNFFLAKSIEIENKIDCDNIIFNGVKLEKGKTYALANLYYQNIYSFSENIYGGITIDNKNTSIFLNFSNVTNGPHKIKYENNTYNKIISLDKLEKVKIVRDKFDLCPLDWYIDKQKNEIYTKIIESSRIHDNRKDIPKLVLTNDNTELFIPSSNLDIHFKVGDLVLISDWESPEEMLKLRVIVKFEIDEENKSINIITQTQNGELNSCKYINFRYGSIYMGKIRKVSLEYNGLKAGLKIKAKVPGIVGFPKKDINQIIAFITDTGTKYPLILCSNYLTLWANEQTLNKFDVIDITNKKYGKLINSSPVNIEKLKFQNGDLCICRDIIGYIKTSSTVVTYFDLISYDIFYSSTCKWRSEYKRYGFLEPRISPTKLTTCEVFDSIPNFHGGYYIHNSDGSMLKNGLLIKKDWSEYV